jgi:hypothetical protein
MNTDNLIIVVWLLFAEYVLVFMAILADLWSGVRKAKHRGEARTSFGFRRTVEKLARYYNLLLVLTIIDAMQILGLWYMHQYYGWTIPLAPVITFFGSLGLGFIELKSIYEKAEDKEFKRMTELTARIVANRGDSKEIADEIYKYLNEKRSATK